MKKLFITIGLIILTIVTFFCYNTEKNKKYYTIGFLVNGNMQIDCWKDEESNKSYVCLPSYADLSLTTFSVDHEKKVLIEGTEIKSGMNCSRFELGKEYSLIIEDYEPQSIIFLKSANVATMYIKTKSGSLKNIHSNKDNIENADLLLYNDSGQINYNNTVQINGHGNATWNYSEKKPYNLNFNSPTELLNIGKSAKWVLLANSNDKTNLRNKLILDFAYELKPFEGFSQECKFVDLYLNNEYRGLYLLCMSPKRLMEQYYGDEIDCFFETNGIIDSSDRFTMNSKMSVDVILPRKKGDDTVTKINRFITETHSALLDQNGINTQTGKHWNEYVDLDSWARKYLIDEIFLNYDGGVRSQYYFSKRNTTVYFSGPCWDYDLTFTWFSPQCFMAQRIWYENDSYTPWFYFMWNYKEFRDYVIMLYQNDFLPKLQELVATVINYETTTIKSASDMNAIRWKTNSDSTASSNLIKDVLAQRIAFLNSAWIDGVDYKTITLKTPVKNSDDYFSYSYYTTPVGTVCENLPTPADLNIKTQSSIWYYENSDEPFNYNTIITQDITLYVLADETNYSGRDNDELNLGSSDFFENLYNLKKYILKNLDFFITISLFSVLTASLCVMFIIGLKRGKYYGKRE